MSCDHDVANEWAHCSGKNASYTTTIFENLEDSCGPRIWQALVIVNVYAPAIAKCLQENLSTSDLQPVSNKQMSNAYGGIGFCKEEAKTFAQLLLHWDHGMNNGRPIKIPFLWRHKFPLGYDRHVSKFPIQSLYYPCLDSSSACVHVFRCGVGVRSSVLQT